MPLRDPNLAIRVLLDQHGPMSADELQKRVDGASAIADEMCRAGELYRRPDGRLEPFGS